MLKAFLVSIFSIISTQVLADCPQFFVNQQKPTFVDTIPDKSRELCFMEFTLLHSGLSRTPLWSAEHLTRENVQKGMYIGRRNNFYEETQIPEDERSTLNDYRYSGYDRGHMSPNGDMSSKKAKQETFTLANMVPQHPCNNQVVWETIERTMRKLAMDVGEIYVVTGPAFMKNELDSLKGRVLVPTHVFKAVYIPSQNKAMAYWAPNNDSLTSILITIEELTKRIGIDVFPGLSAYVKNTAIEFPPLEETKYKCRTH